MVIRIGDGVVFVARVCVVVGVDVYVCIIVVGVIVVAAVVDAVVVGVCGLVWVTVFFLYISPFFVAIHM